MVAFVATCSICGITFPEWFEEQTDAERNARMNGWAKIDGLLVCADCELKRILAKINTKPPDRAGGASVPSTPSGA